MTDPRHDLPTLQEQVNLLPFNTLRVAAIADRLAVIKKKAHLSALYRENYLDNGYWVLGEGSNVLLKGRIKQMVLKNEINFLEVVEQDEQNLLLRVGGGKNWHELVKTCVERGWGGLENLALIPGTVGAGPVQNIGAYGVELEERFVSLEAFDFWEGEFRLFNREECGFGYRDSIFKSKYKGRYFITSVTLSLRRNSHEIRRNYKSLDGWLKKEGVTKPGIRDIFEAVVAIRTQKLPDPKDLGNAGSFFKNPVVNSVLAESLKNRYPDMPAFPVDDSSVKIPAGWLIEKTGWKGKRIGNTGTYENQALVIVNHGGATGEEILLLAKQIQESVRKEFGIDLVPEVNIVGNNNVT